MGAVGALWVLLFALTAHFHLQAQLPTSSRSAYRESLGKLEQEYGELLVSIW